MILRIIGLWKVKVAHLLLLEGTMFVLDRCSLFCTCELSFIIVELGRLLALAMCNMFVHSSCFCCCVSGKQCILFKRKPNAATLCSCGWLEVLCMTVSVVVVFLYIPILISVLVL
jgi:hypothetical protein